MGKLFGNTKEEQVKIIETMGYVADRNFLQARTDHSGWSKGLYYFSSNIALYDFYATRDALLIFTAEALVIHYGKEWRPWLKVTKKQRQLNGGTVTIPYEEISDFSVDEGMTDIKLQFKANGQMYYFNFFDNDKGKLAFRGENYHYLAANHWMNLEGK